MAGCSSPSGNYDIIKLLAVFPIGTSSKSPVFPPPPTGTSSNIGAYDGGGISAFAGAFAAFLVAFLAGAFGACPYSGNYDI